MATTQSRKTARKSSGRTSAKASSASRARKQSTGSRTSKTSAKKSAGKQSVADGSLLKEFFLNALKDIYWAEKALTKALPKMAKETSSSQLKTAFNNHLKETEKQIQRLEQVFEKLGETAKAKKCEAMQGLIEESEEIMKETKDDTSTRDAALIISAQKVEHYEIATYGGLVQLARTLGKTEVAKILQVTLNEEKKADELLTKIAEKGGVNEEAAQEPEEKSSLKENIMSIFSK